MNSQFLDQPEPEPWKNANFCLNLKDDFDQTWDETFNHNKSVSEPWPLKTGVSSCRTREDEEEERDAAESLMGCGPLKRGIISGSEIHLLLH